MYHAMIIRLPWQNWLFICSNYPIDTKIMIFKFSREQVYTCCCLAYIYVNGLVQEMKRTIVMFDDRWRWKRNIPLNVPMLFLVLYACACMYTCMCERVSVTVNSFLSLSPSHVRCFSRSMSTDSRPAGCFNGQLRQKNSISVIDMWQVNERERERE
jgi:hypothetical protein